MFLNEPTNVHPQVNPKIPNVFLHVLDQHWGHIHTSTKHRVLNNRTMNKKTFGYQWAWADFTLHVCHPGHWGHLVSQQWDYTDWQQESHSHCDSTIYRNCCILQGVICPGIVIYMYCCTALTQNPMQHHTTGLQQEYAPMLDIKYPFIYSHQINFEDLEDYDPAGRNRQ